MTRRILIIILACIFLTAGFLMTYQALSHFSENIRLLPEDTGLEEIRHTTQLLTSSLIFILLGLIFLLFYAGIL